MKKAATFLIILTYLSAADFALGYSDHYPYTKTDQCNICSGDAWRFCQNNCTSYVAYKIGVYGFSNNYRGASWGNAGGWKHAANSINDPKIIVDNFPIPGDVAYWDYNWTGDPANKSDDYGHVAYVEKVNYDSNGNALTINITEYNYNNKCNFGQRTISANNPTGFIHILAYEEGITSLFYLDCYEMNCEGQTQEEWKIIADKVWDKYRCKDCDSYYSQAYLNSVETGFGSGNPPDFEDSEIGPGDGNLTNSSSSSSSGSSKKPDLHIKELSFRDGKTKYYSDEKIHIDCYVKNNGKSVDKDIKKIAVKLYRFKGEKENNDTKELGNENIKGENLGDGKTKHEQFEFGAPDDEDKYQFYAIADAKNAVSESDEGNNKSGRIACRVHHRPSIRVKKLDLTDGRTEFLLGECPKATATFTNEGGEPFEDVPVRWYLDGDYIGDDNMRHWNIEHNDIKHEDINLNRLTTGTHTVEVCADSPDDADSSDDCESFTFSVGDLPNPFEPAGDSHNAIAKESPTIATETPVTTTSASTSDSNSSSSNSQTQTSSSSESENSTTSSNYPPNNVNQSNSSESDEESDGKDGGCFIATLYIY